MRRNAGSKGSVHSNWCSGTCFEEYAGFGEYLLLHPGFTDLQERMPDALWRVHIHVLQGGQLFALAQAHLRFSTPQNEQGLLNFLEQAERRSAPLRFPT